MKWSRSTDGIDVSASLPPRVDEAETGRKATDLQELRDAIATASWTIDRRRDIVLEHEKLTALVWLVISVAVASRAKREACPSPRLIDPRTGALLVLDKQTTKGKPTHSRHQANPPGQVLGDARIAFLSPDARDLAIVYHQHLHRLSARMDLTKIARNRCASLAHRLDEGRSVPFFELVRSGKGSRSKIRLRLLGPKAIAQRMQKLLNLKLESNFARHMLRSGLAGCVSHEIIDAQLGHWEQGTEPWSNGSALDPMAVRAMIAAAQAAFVPLGKHGSPDV